MIQKKFQMRTHMFYKSLLLPLLACVLSQAAMAQETVSKTVEKSFPISSKGIFYVDNKYGDVEIIGTEGETAEVKMSVKITDKSEEEALDLLERVQPEFKIVGDMIYLSSEILEKSGSVISRYFKKANPLNSEKNHVQIKYTIQLPKKTNLQVINRYGDLIIDSFFGDLTADIQHGDIWINNDLGKASIKLKFGKLKAHEISNASIELKNAELVLRKANEVTMITSGSVVEIEELEILNLTSSKDKFSLGRVDWIKGDSKFSVMNIDSLGRYLELSLKITDLLVSELGNKNPNIIIDQDSSDIEINITGTSFKFIGYYSEGAVKLPKTFRNIESDIIDKSKKLREIHADYGEYSTGKISVNGHKGELILIDATLSRNISDKE